MRAWLIPEEGLSPAAFNTRSEGVLPGHLGFEVTAISREGVTLACAIARHHHAPNGFLHGGTVVALADTAAGFATLANLRAGDGFTTIELKTNFFATALAGTLRAVASPLHRGRTTQVWDVRVSHQENDRTLALFRCTNLVLGQS